MQRAILAFVVAALLVLACAIPVSATNPESLPASVTITSYINFTVSDTLPLGITFGSHNPTAGVVEDSGQDTSSPSVMLTVLQDTNVPVKVQVGASGDFSTGTGASIPIANAKWAKTSITGTRNDMSVAFAEIQAVPVTGSPTGIKVWNFLQIPETAQGGTYQTNFIYRAVQQ